MPLLVESDAEAVRQRRRLAAQFSADPALAVGFRDMDGHRNGAESGFQASIGCCSLESAGKLLLDEAIGKLAPAPSLIVHHRREERNVVPDALDVKAVERRGH